MRVLLQRSLITIYFVAGSWAVCVEEGSFITEQKNCVMIILNTKGRKSCTALSHYPWDYFLWLHYSDSNEEVSIRKVPNCGNYFVITITSCILLSGSGNLCFKKNSWCKTRMVSTALMRVLHCYILIVFVITSYGLKIWLWVINCISSIATWFTGDQVTVVTQLTAQLTHWKCGWWHVMSTIYDSFLPQNNIVEFHSDVTPFTDIVTSLWLTQKKKPVHLLKIKFKKMSYHSIHFPNRKKIQEAISHVLDAADRICAL
jgi:hypothetical protein